MRALCVGEMMLDMLVYPVKKISFENETDEVEGIEVKSGGDANNNAIDLARLGNKVYYVGRVGQDALSTYALDIARDAGVNVDYVAYSESSGIAKSLILINEEGDREFLQYGGSSREFCLGDIDKSLLDKVDILQIGGTFHLTRFDGEEAAQLLHLAQKKGVITSMDVTKDPSGRWNEIIECCYPYLDYFLPSIEQAERIAGTSDERKIADFFLERGVKTVVVKLGTRGSFCKTEGKAFYCGCYKVKVAETTGAGDAFVAGFLTAVGRKASLEDCISFATAVSAHAVQAVGATNGVPNYEQIMRFIEEQPELHLEYAEENN